MPSLSIVTSTETFKSAVLCENKGLFLGGKISYYARPTIDGKRLKGVEFAQKNESVLPLICSVLRRGHLCLCQGIKGHFVSPVFLTSSERQAAVACFSRFPSSISECCCAFAASVGVFKRQSSVQTFLSPCALYGLGPDMA